MSILKKDIENAEIRFQEEQTEYLDGKLEALKFADKRCDEFIGKLEDKVRPKSNYALPSGFMIQNIEVLNIIDELIEEFKEKK